MMTLSCLDASGPSTQLHTSSRVKRRFKLIAHTYDLPILVVRFMTFSGPCHETAILFYSWYGCEVTLSRHVLLLFMFRMRMAVGVFFSSSIKKHLACHVSKQHMFSSALDRGIHIIACVLAKDRGRRANCVCICLVMHGCINVGIHTITCAAFTRSSDTGHLHITVRLTTS